MEVLYNLGVDISSNHGFVDGDLKIVSYNDNLVQAILNRFNTQLNELDLFYEDYGSVLSNFFGWRATTDTLAIIKVELETVLKEEPRLLDFETNVFYNKNGRLTIELVLKPSDDTTIETNFVLNEFGVLEEVE